MAETLSGLDLRRAIVEKIQWRRWNAIDGFTEIPIEECPAFERDLGALQQAGVIDALVCKSTHSLEIQMMGHDIPDTGKIWASVDLEHYDFEGDMGPAYTGADGSTDEGQKASAALATAICRAYLTLA